MDFINGIEAKEEAIIKLLRVQQSGIDNRTGKGSGVERIVEEELLRPNLPRNFDICKGSVIGSDKLDKQSPAIDRIIYDTSISGPLIYSPDHSIFPLETVCGLVEITLNMDARKLKNDIKHIAYVNNTYIRKNFLIPEKDTITGVKCFPRDDMTPRAFIIGLPGSNTWRPKNIAKSLQDSQESIGKNIHIHGLYVLGIGFFETSPIENQSFPRYEIKTSIGKERLLYFADSFRIAFNRWYQLPQGSYANLKRYHKEDMKILCRGIPNIY